MLNYQDKVLPPYFLLPTPYSLKMKKPSARLGFFIFNPGDDLLSHAVTRAVPWALEGLTTVFEMGTGGSPPVWPPENS